MVPGTLPLLLFCCCGYLLVGLAFLPGLEKEAAGCTIKGRDARSPLPDLGSRYRRREAAPLPLQSIRLGSRLMSGVFTAACASQLSWFPG